MKLLSILSAFVLFPLLFSFSSKDSNENEIINSLDVSSISEFSANPGAQSVTVTSNLNWMASENASWISITPTNGSGNG